MTPLTFSNPLKFGPDSAITSKVDLPFSTEIERERALKTLRETCTRSLRGVLQRGPVRVGAVATADGRTKARNGGGGFSASVPIEAGVDKLAIPLGIDESLAFRAFDKTIIFGHWLSKTWELSLASKAFLFEKGFYYILLEYFQKSKNLFPKHQGRL